MQLDWAVLAEHVQVRDGLAFMLGGGIDTVQTEQLPAALHATVLLRLLVHRTEADRDHAIDVRIMDEDGAELLKVHRHIRARISEDLPLGWDIPVMTAFAISHLELPREGRYSIEVLADGTHLKSLNLRVRLATPVQR